jgi:hypothetical protein
MRWRMKNEASTEMLFRIRKGGRTPEVMERALDGTPQQVWKDGEWVGMKRVYMTGDARRR